MKFLEQLFKLKQNNSNVKTELIAGTTIFMTTAYILAVNPAILSATGMDIGAIFTATAIASLVGTLFMAFFANYPFVLAPGMGLNAYFAYTIVLGMGYSWQTALAAVFIEGLIFILLSVTSVREQIFNAVPKNLKVAVSVGIGLFITFIGLQSSKIVIGGPTLLTLFSLDKFNSLNATSASFNDLGISVLLAIIGLLITSFLVIKKVKGNMLLGIFITWILGIICQVLGIYKVNPELGCFNLLPDFSRGLIPPSISPIFMKFDFTNLFSLQFAVVVFALLFVDIFDTIGTLIGVSSQANMLDKDGKLPNIKGALLADACATTIGACLGTSTVTTFVESASGVAEGARTGLSAFTAAILFGLSLFLSPIFLAIPSFATAPVLIVVGFYMFSNISKLDFSDFTESIPAFICIIAMPFFYSISEGIALGMLSYTILNLLSGKYKKLNPIIYILSILFILKYIFL